MSLAAQVWAWEQPLEGTAKLVLLCLAEHADAEGRCWPSVARIAQRCGISERTAQRALRLLEAGAAIGVEVRSGSTPVYCLDVRAVVRPLGLPGAGKAAQRILPLPVVVGGRRSGTGCQNGTGDDLSAAGVTLSPGGVNLSRGGVTLAPKPVSNQSENLPGNQGAAERGSRCPEDFVPNETGMGFAAARGVDVAAQVPAFIAYWRGRSGKGALSPDWQARWRTWCIKDQEFRTGRSTRVVRGSRSEAVAWFLGGRGS